MPRLRALSVRSIDQHALSCGPSSSIIRPRAAGPKERSVPRQLSPQRLPHSQIGVSFGVSAKASLAKPGRQWNWWKTMTGKSHARSSVRDQARFRSARQPL
jgi:hypothetical protein